MLEDLAPGAASPAVSDPTRVGLRFGIMCDGLTLVSWQVDCIRRVLEIPSIEPALVIVNSQPEQPSSKSEKIRKLLRGKDLFWAALLRLGRLSSTEAGKRLDASELFAGVPQLHCAPYRKGKWSEYFHDGDLKVIRSHRLDFILKFAFGIIRGEILETPRYGVWSFHHDDPSRYRGKPPAFWEMQAGDPVTGAVLQRLTERLDGGVILQSCFVSTDFTSYRSNWSRVHAASAAMPAKVCRDLLLGKAAYVNAPPIKTEAPVLKAPRNGDMVRFFTRMVAAWVRKQVDSLLFVESWDVGLVHAPVQSFLESGFRPEVEWLPYRRPKAFIADPFLSRAGPEPEILAEEFDHVEHRGWIVAIRRGGDGSLDVAKAIDHGIHMSYPYYFEHGGGKYCIPECAAAREVALYMLDRGRWVKVAVLVQDFAALDATVIRHEGLWWMFATDGEGPTDSTLYIWFADELRGPWKAHPRNPVKIDVRSSRPAGTPFVHEGRLYRPAQNCAVRYGHSTSINRIDVLTPDDFVETTIRSFRHLDGSPHANGFHTLAGLGGLTVVDGQRRDFVPQMSIRRLSHKIRKVAGFQ